MAFSEGDTSGQMGPEAQSPHGLKRLIHGIASRLPSLPPEPDSSQYNAPGDFSVDVEACQNFGVCLPGSLGMLGRVEVDKATKTHFRRQPATEQELRRALNALLECPLNAIKYKGDPFHPEAVALYEGFRAEEKYYQEEVAAERGPFPDCE